METLFSLLRMIPVPTRRHLWSAVVPLNWLKWIQMLLTLHFSPYSLLKWVLPWWLQSHSIVELIEMTLDNSIQQQTFPIEKDVWDTFGAFLSMYPFGEIEPENKESTLCEFQSSPEKEANDMYINMWWHLLWECHNCGGQGWHQMSPAQQRSRKNEGVDCLNLKAWGSCYPHYKPKA